MKDIELRYVGGHVEVYTGAGAFLFSADTSTVQILNRVTLKNITTGKVVEYTLVSENEANLKEGKLSIGTPIAQALLGHKKGEEVDVTVPSGVLRFEILNISI